MPDYPIVDTVGIEFETEQIANGITTRSLPNGWSTHSDASIESDGVFSSSAQLVLKGSSSLIPQTQGKVIVGTEIVSVPMDLTSIDVFSKLREICSYVESQGEYEESYRAGIHFHVCMPISLRVMKSALRLMTHLEDVFFQVAGNTYEFRGQRVAESSYCRPLTSYGPQCVPTPKGWAQCFNVKDLLNADTIATFWYRYGETVPSRSDRYVPQRYSLLNFYSLNQHSTIEFRPFNKTLNPYFLYAELRLCQKFCEYVMKTSFESLRDEGMGTVNSVFDRRPKKDIVRTLLHFAEVADLDIEVVKTLLRIIERTPPVVLPNNYVFSHLRQAMGRTYWQDGGYSPTIIPASSIVTVKLEDIHALRGERR